MGDFRHCYLDIQATADTVAMVVTNTVAMNTRRVTVPDTIKGTVVHCKNMF